MTTQERVAAWVRTALNEEAPRDVPERAYRALEEAIELAQACGLGAGSAHTLVERVYAKPVGDPKKELAGCQVTLYAVAEALGANLESEFEIEMVRINRPEVIERVRRRRNEMHDARAEPSPDQSRVFVVEQMRKLASEWRTRYPLNKHAHDWAAMLEARADAISVKLV